MKVIGYKLETAKKKAVDGFPTLKSCLKQEFDDGRYWIEVYDKSSGVIPYLSFIHGCNKF